MIKFLTKVFIILFLFTFQSNSNEIVKIEIYGNKRISKETILVLSGIKKGQDFSSIRLNESLKKLYETNFFNDIKFTLNNGLLKIQLNENPIIEKLNILGIKKKSFVEQIYNSISLKDRMSYTENAFNRDINLIKNILQTNGYYFSKISVDQQTNLELNSIILNLDIDLGEKAKIDEIVFIGNKKVKDKKLLEIIASEEHKFWKFLTNRVYLNQSLISLDRRLLENFYKNQGYYKVNVLDSFAELDKRGSFKLTYNINSGDKYFLNDLNLVLPDDYDTSDFKNIYEVLNNLKKKPYNLNNIDSILDEIDRVASLRLYDFISVEVEEKIVDQNNLNLNFIVKETEKFYVEKINILGNFNTIEEVIRNKLVVDEGDPYNELLFNKSINEIKSLGIFKTVSSEILDGSDENSKILNLKVEEKPTGEISMGAGYGTDGGVFGASITEKNFLGKGVTLDADLQLTNDGIKGKVTYAKPNFNYSDNTLFTTIKSTNQDYLKNSGYKITNIGVSVGTEFEQYENLFFRPELDLSQEDLTTNSTASTNFKKQEGSYSDFYFNYGLIYDTRDMVYQPTSGSVMSFYQDVPIITTNKEISNTFIYTKYKKLNSNDMVGKVSIYLKAINSLDNSDVRISKRANLPASRLRGFEKGKIGPIDNGDFVGGNYATSLNFSTNLPGLLYTLENVDFNYFFDIANVWGVDYDANVNDASEIRSSTGIALDYLSPIGPLNFSWAIPITKKSSDKTEVFRFNLGTTF